MVKKQKTLIKQAPKNLPLPTLPSSLSRQKSLTQYILSKPSLQNKLTHQNLSIQSNGPSKNDCIIKSKQKSGLAGKQKKIISKRGKSKQKQKYQNDKIVKLQRGYKFCQNCHAILNIHKYVCTQCKFVHRMKKHKFNVMKNLSKGTPKIVKSIIECNEFNFIKLNSYKNLSPVSFKFRQISPVKYNINSKNTNLVFEQNLFVRNSQENPNLNMKILEQNKIRNMIQKDRNKREQLFNYQARGCLAFQPISVLTGQAFINKNEACQEHQKIKSTKNYEQFSVYKSEYPVTNLQPICLNVSVKSLGCPDFLLFTESISKKQFYSEAIDLSQINQEYFSQKMSEKDSDENNYPSKSYQHQIKIQEKILKSKKANQNNSLTQRAFGLQKFHRIGSIYQGQTLLNIIQIDQKFQRQNSLASQSQKSQNFNLNLPQTVRRRLSNNSFQLRSLKGMEENQKQNQAESTLKNLKYQTHLNNHRFFRIGLTEHIEMVKAIVNKLAILTGKKQILFLNLNFEIFKEKLFLKKISEYEKNDNGIIWLCSDDFISESESEIINEKQFSSYKYLTKIALSEEDQFTVIQWLKIHSQFQQRSHKQTQNRAFLIAGTLYGHILVYRVSSTNQASVYRQIVGAHFQLINCIKECPLNNSGSSLFATASYDGRIKVWDLEHKNAVCQFEVSNRKVQEIHWDSGAKFLLIVRDEGLENCYLSCFYSISNRIELPMTLSDTIDFRLIRNGNIFGNSCSPLVTLPLNSKIVVMINPRNGFLKILETEYLRKTSIKRKKSKKNSQQQIYRNFWIRLISHKTKQVKLIESENNQIEQNPLSENYFPQIIQMEANSSALIHEASVAESVLQGCKQDKKQEMIARQYCDSNILNNMNKEQEVKSGKYLKKQNNQKIVFKGLSSETQRIENQGNERRKSLRMRKHNFQYNFTEEQHLQEVEKSSFDKSKIKKAKNKQPSSDEEDFLDQQNENHDSEQQSNEDQLFIAQQPSKLAAMMVQNSPNQFQINKNKQRLNAKNNKSRKVNFSEKTLTKSGQKNSNQCMKESLDSKLYKLFWQQTSQQSLQNKIQHYPSNKFPKFSSITSFVFSEERDGNLGNRNQKISQSNSNDQIHKKLIENQPFGDLSEISENQENKKNTGNKKNKKIENLDDKIRDQKTKQLEYSIIFIAGYGGELIKVKIQIESQKKFGETDDTVV